LEEELEEYWEKSKGKKDKIAVKAFVKMYEEIEDLFEEDGEEEEASTKIDDSASDEITMDDDDEATIAELEPIFIELVGDEGKTVTQEAVMKWEEVQNLLKDGLFDEEEFESIWQKTPKAPGSKMELDFAGFLKFNAALDELFDFDEDELLAEEEEEEEGGEISDAASSVVESDPSAVITDADLSPAALFEALSDSDGLVGMEDLNRWGELQNMLAEEELMPLELANFYDAIKKDPKNPNKLDRAGFLALYDKIDALFEEDGDDGEQTKSPAPAPAKSSSVKNELLAGLEIMNQDDKRLPCGLEATEREQKIVQELVTKLEAEATNIIRERKGAIAMTELAGLWELVYSSSAAMAYNKGLSGLGGSFPNGKFGGLKMKLSANKYMTDLEYVERINVVPDSASFDVTVNGVWEIKSSVSIFTGEPSVVLSLRPERVTYGPTSTRADHWKSLGPTNMLDVSYLDEDLRIMRGNTATDSILVFKRTKS